MNNIVKFLLLLVVLVFCGFTLFIAYQLYRPINVSFSNTIGTIIDDSDLPIAAVDVHIGFTCLQSSFVDSSTLKVLEQRTVKTDSLGRFNTPEYDGGTVYDGSLYNCSKRFKVNSDKWLCAKVTNQDSETVELHRSRGSGNHSLDCEGYINSYRGRIIFNKLDASAPPGLIDVTIKASDEYQQ